MNDSIGLQHIDSVMSLAYSVSLTYKLFPVSQTCPSVCSQYPFQLSLHPQALNQ